MEKASTKVTMIFISVLWVVFLLGIILHEPYTQKNKQEQPTEQINQIEGETNQ